MLFCMLIEYYILMAPKFTYNERFLHGAIRLWEDFNLRHLHHMYNRIITVKPLLLPVLSTCQSELLDLITLLQEGQPSGHGL